MKKRNPDAVCETCPYWGKNSDDVHGQCRRKSPPIGSYKLPFGATTAADFWCGDHPEFWLAGSDWAIIWNNFSEADQYQCGSYVQKELTGCLKNGDQVEIMRDSSNPTDWLLFDPLHVISPRRFPSLEAARDCAESELLNELARNDDDQGN